MTKPAFQRDQGMAADVQLRDRFGQTLDRLLRFVRRRARTPGNADEFVAEAMVRAISKGVTGADRGDDAVIVRIALNAETDEFRRHWRRRVEADCYDFAAMPDPAPLQDEVLIMRERLVRVAEGVAALPPRSREALLMRRLEGLSYREIAQRMNISESGVEKHIARATRFLMDWAAGW